jgi:hypothetical protein
LLRIPYGSGDLPVFEITFSLSEHNSALNSGSRWTGNHSRRLRAGSESGFTRREMGEVYRSFLNTAS